MIVFVSVLRRISGRSLLIRLNQLRPSDQVSANTDESGTSIHVFKLSDLSEIPMPRLASFGVASQPVALSPECRVHLADRNQARIPQSNYALPSNRRPRPPASSAGFAFTENQNGPASGERTRLGRRDAPT
jgi:hypothetical protein